MENVENQEENKMLKILLNPFEVVLNYFKEVLRSDKKPLGEKTQIKVREKLHQILSPLSSWVADNVVKYFEQQTDEKAIEEINEKGTTIFLEQAKGYVGSLYNNLKTHLKQTSPEKADRAKPTILCGITNIIERASTATQNLFNSHSKTISAKQPTARTV